MLINVGNPLAVLERGEVQAAARTLGLEVITLEIRRGEDIAPAFEALKGRAEALYVVLDPLVTTHRIRINTLVLAARLPTMHTLREGVEAGASEAAQGQIWCAKVGVMGGANSSSRCNPSRSRHSQVSYAAYT
jgi:ABC-type uncharacterized transport system substrate-binding protein